MIKTKSIYYGRKEPDDGTRILVMRRWPRGISRDQIDEWRKDLGPSVELLRQWNDGEIDFAEFRERYLAEMQGKTEEVRELARRARIETIDHKLADVPLKASLSESLSYNTLAKND